MSQAEQNKIELFRQEIMAKASAERDAIVSATEETKRQELDHEQGRQLEELYQLMQAKIAEINLELARELSLESRTLRQQLYKQREQYLQEVLMRSRADLIAFTRTPEYADYLRAKIKRLAADYPPESSTVLELREEDMPLAAELSALYGDAPVRASTQIAIGGLRMVNSARGVAVNYTLEEALEEQREWFYSNSHFKFE